MVKVEITYTCDKCGKIKKEKPIIQKGYEEVGYFVENEDAAYMPDGWVYVPDDEQLLCDKCAYEDGDDIIAIA